MLLLRLDGDGPFGDCYQVNSANNGPYGDAITRELIPEVEKRFRAIGQPYARVLEGGSTGGWVSLALQVFYPDFFNGTWFSNGRAEMQDEEICYNVNTTAISDCDNRQARGIVTIRERVPPPREPDRSTAQ